MNRLLISISIILIIISWNLVRLNAQEHAHFTNVNTDSIFVSTELLGCPTDQSITINALAREDLEVYFEYGTEPSQYTNQTVVKLFPGLIPIEVTIEKLLPNTRYYYRMRYRFPGASEFLIGGTHTFHTQRPAGASFTFAIEADPHLDEQTNPEIYKRTLQNILADNPDFLIDLGDTFMSDKLPLKNKTEVVNRHLLLRSYFDKTCHSVPLFLVIGNHEGESGWNLNGTAENLAIWATNTRKLYYPNPAPDNFYTGNNTAEKFVGLRENYYAFNWGDALFIVLDPYWYTTRKPGNSDDNWDWTLGEKQYRWFRETLENSKAAFKFVFCHHLVGGLDTEGRGGSEAAKYYEWGGLNADGSWGFDEKRPGWGKPIHQLMLENKVAIFFHGHDHFFAKQEQDGIIYQEVPQPGHPNYEKAGQASKYGYITGDILPSSGHLRVTVSNATVTVDYVRAYQPADEDPGKGRINGKVDYSYTLRENSTSTKAFKNVESIPNNYILAQNYPNPFNPDTNISFSIPKDEKVTLKIYNTLGENIVTIIDDVLPTGTYHLCWQPINQPGGVYFITLKAGTNFQTRKMLFLQ